MVLSKGGPPESYLFRRGCSALHGGPALQTRLNKPLPVTAGVPHRDQFPSAIFSPCSTAGKQLVPGLKVVSRHRGGRVAFDKGPSFPWNPRNSWRAAASLRETSKQIRPCCSEASSCSATSAAKKRAKPVDGPFHFRRTCPEAPPLNCRCTMAACSRKPARRRQFPPQIQTAARVRLGQPGLPCLAGCCPHGGGAHWYRQISARMLTKTT